MNNFIEKKNQLWARFEYCFIIFYLVFGYFLYDILPISVIDEVSAILLLLILIVNKKEKEVNLFLIVVSFFFLFSVFFSVNRSYEAIFLDAIQQIKPFVFFYFFFNSNVQLNEQQTHSLSKISFGLAVLSFIVGISLDYHFYSGLFSHPAGYGIKMFVYGLLYYYYSIDKQKSKKVFFFIITLGLLSMRSKYFGYYIISVYLLYFLKSKIRISIKYLLILILLVSLIIYFTQEKLLAYLGDDAIESQARTVLYVNSPRVLMDYPIFGSGLATYASWFSGVYYSPLYSLYGIDNVWGISEEFPDFIADTYFPELVQFGLFGLFLFFMFWKKRICSISKCYCNSRDDYCIGWIIVSFVFIESIASPMLLTMNSLIPLYLLAKITRKDDTQSNSLLLVRPQSAARFGKKMY